ncbi:precorrin-2 C(20)-methyltransferase [Pseudonocardia nigra]|uniref:precorrin-2 C(20)-methyltransferase n=1 Tax=Pseudonocardia nigra TaxID=1921578 RepID=UPI001C5F69A3|nr:precorrin-2 C(20)-methyltransferase [Pseudonocardia nigra]
MNRLIGLGVGPGDPELVTVKAANLLAKADVVFVPVADSGETGRAEQTVLHYAEAWRVERVVFALHDREHTARRERAWDAAAAQVADWFAAHPGGTAAFATIGDPCVYSTFTYLAATVRELVGDLAVELVPGVTAMQDLAARSGTPLVEGRESLALFPMTAGAERFRTALESFDAVVAYKFGRMLPETLAVLRETGRLDEAVYGAGLGLATEDIRAARDLDPGEPGPYLSTLIVPPKRTGRGHGLR